MSQNNCGQNGGSTPPKVFSITPNSVYCWSLQSESVSMNMGIRLAAQ